jgi:hypothetical protein
MFLQKVLRTSLALVLVLRRPRGRSCRRRRSERSSDSAVLLPVLLTALLSDPLWTAIHAGYDQLPKPVLNTVLPSAEP